VELQKDVKPLPIHYSGEIMHIEIRQSTVDDAESIGRLAAEFQSYLRALGDERDFDWDARKYLRDGFGEDPAFEGLVAEVDSSVVGYALYHFGYDTDRGQRLVYLIDLFVSQPFRRAGIGDKLMHCLSEVGRSRRAEYLVWSVLKGYSLATRFYERLGATHADDLHFMLWPIEGRGAAKSESSGRADPLSCSRFSTRISFDARTRCRRSPRGLWPGS
jgi:GNAT superfamily N-acetyltransferase